MPLMEDDHMVQTLPADTPNQPLHKGILPRTPGGDQDLFDPHVPHALPKGRSVNVIPIAKEVRRDAVPRTYLQHLLGGPLCRGVLGYIEVHDATPLMSQYHEHKEQFVSDRRHDKEIPHSTGFSGRPMGLQW